MDGTLEKRKAWNPRFVLRQWVLEDIIKKVEGREKGCREELNKILKVSVRVVRVESSRRTSVWILVAEEESTNEERS